MHWIPVALQKKKDENTAPAANTEFLYERIDGGKTAATDLSAIRDSNVTKKDQRVPVCLGRPK